MERSDLTIVCPDCGLGVMSLVDYDSLMVLKEGLGLFTFQCPNCDQKVSSIQPIPAILNEEVWNAAQQVHAGMSRNTGGNHNGFQGS